MEGAAVSESLLGQVAMAARVACPAGEARDSEGCLAIPVERLVGEVKRALPTSPRG